MHLSFSLLRVKFAFKQTLAFLLAAYRDTSGALQPPTAGRGWHVLQIVCSSPLASVTIQDFSVYSVELKSLTLLR